MRTARRLAYTSALLFVALACADRIAAPGACPEFCLPQAITVTDLLLEANVERDSAYRGYLSAWESSELHVAGGGGATESWAVVRFLRFSNEVISNLGGTVPIVQVDSFRIDLVLNRFNRAADDFELVVHRLPFGVDSTTTFEAVAPFVADSTIVGVVALADSALTDSIVPDTVSATIPAAALSGIEGDSLAYTVAVSARASSSTFAGLGAANAARAARLTRFVQIDSAGVLVTTQDARSTAFDSFVRPPLEEAPPDALVIGESPSARALLRLRLPPSIIDSSEVVGAKLLLVPVVPVGGAAADTFRVQANGVGADFGPKSPLVVVLSSDVDSTGLSFGARVVPGSLDTVAVDITAIVRGWQIDSTRPHTLLLRVTPEAASLARFAFGSSRHPTAAPAIRVTFVPPFSFEGR